ncbi:MAG: tetratricopeptide repeat protein [Bacteroidia bacterium]|nr:tetratricopeptide repeat protein [Bacteroidia bacterium]
MYVYKYKSLPFLFSFFLFCLISSSVSSQYTIDYNQSVRNIYKNIIDLKLSQVPNEINELRIKQPYNLAVLHLENYHDFFNLFINEDEKAFKRLVKNKNKRLKLIDKHLLDNNPFKRFLKAEINLQWALARSKFGQLFRASGEIYTAYNLLEENQNLFPDFIYNKKSLSILHSLVETITLPGIMKRLFGLSGSISLAKEEINEVIEFSKREPFIFKEEADAIKIFVLFYQANEKAEAWAYAQNCSLNADESLLAVFLISKIAQRIGENDVAIKMLENRPRGNEYSSFQYLEYQLGLSKLRKLDPRAVDHIDFYLKNFNGRHFIKEAYQKMAWSKLIFEDSPELYQKFISKVESFGDNLVDDDKQAMAESKRGQAPDRDLLSVRLLFDGGYYEQALELAEKIKGNYGEEHAFHLEYKYRVGRILQQLGKSEEAINAFKYVLAKGGNDDAYFACAASLQIGLIYEGIGGYKNAELYFQKCLDLTPTDYKRSLHQKAKSGMKRIELN